MARQTWQLKIAPLFKFDWFVFDWAVCTNHKAGWRRWNSSDKKIVGWALGHFEHGALWTRLMLVRSKLIKPAGIERFSDPAMPSTVRGKYKFDNSSNSLTFSLLFRPEMRLKRQRTTVGTRKRFARFPFLFSVFLFFFVHLLSGKNIEIPWERLKQLGQF